MGVGYAAEPEPIPALLLDAVRGHKDVLAFPEPYAWFRDFGESSLDYSVRVYIQTSSNRFGVENDLRVAIFKALRQAGVEIPFPQRDVHIKDARPARAGETNQQAIAEAYRDLGFDAD